MMTSRRHLIEKIQQFQLDETNARFPFSARLAKENGWSMYYSRRVCREYLRFVALMAISDRPLSPSPDVDQAWHLHLSYSRSYWERLCKELVGRPIHHEPTKGGLEETAKFKGWYERTLELYESTFEESPPPDIWPRADNQRREPVHRWIDANRYWLVSKRVVSKAFAALSLCFVMTVCLAWAAPNANAPFPFNLNGPDFLLLYLTSLGGAIVFGVVVRAIQFNASADEFSLPKLSANEVALLQGGPQQAITAAIYSLKHRGNIEIVSAPAGGAKKGEAYIAHSVGALEKSASPLERKIFEYLREGENSLINVCRELKPACEVMEESLVEKGLMYPKGLQGMQRMDILALLPVTIVVLLGVVRCFQGVINLRPVEFLIFSVVFALFSFGGLAFRWGRCTPFGRRALREEFSHAEPLRSKLRSSRSDLAASDMLLGVALFGPMLWAGPGSTDLGTWVGQSYRKVNTNSTSSGSGCGGTSSCGGSGCGGSGCGGCGGGGD